MNTENLLLGDVVKQTDIARTRSLEQLTDEELKTHLAIARYGDFELTAAVRPSYDLRVVPSQGYRHDRYDSDRHNLSVPVLMAAVSRQDLFEVFMSLLDPLGDEVDVVLETSHSHRNHGRHEDLYREHIDLPVLKSILWDYEDLLLNDGCAGIAVLNPDIPQEVQFDEHKLLIVYGHELRECERILDHSGVNCRDDMKFVTEAEHVHSSSDELYEKFEELKVRLGCD